MLNRFADWLSTTIGFFTQVGTLVIGFVFGVFFGFSEVWQSPFNLFISIATMLIGGIILVGQAAQERALQKKLDEVLRAIPEANDDLIGVEKRESC